MPDITPLKFTEEQKRVWKAAYAPNATVDQWALFTDECERRALLPGKHVVFQLRNSSEKDSVTGQWIQTKRPALITTIDALRLIAERAGKYKGHRAFTYYYKSENTLEKDIIPQGRIPHAVSVEILRSDWPEPLFSVARYDAYVQMKGRDNDRKPTEMWEKRGEEQLAKCALANGLREIAPEECGGLYIGEEMGESAAESVQATTAPIPQSLAAPAVNQAAAVEHAESPSGLPKAVIPALPFVATDDDLPATFFEPKADDLDRRLAAGERGIPKIPNAPDTRHAVPVPRAGEGSLFASTTPPPAEHSTMAFPTPQPVEQAPKPVVLAPAPQSPAPAPPPAAPVSVSDGRATGDQYAAFMQRATKILHDLAAKNVFKGSSMIMQPYLLAGTGKTRISHLTADEFETKIKALETAPTLEGALTLLKGAK